MLRSFYSCLAFLFALSVHLQAQTSLADPDRGGASLIASSSSSLEPADFNSGDDDDSLSGFGNNPSVRSTATILPRTVPTSMRPFSKVAVGFNAGLLGVGVEIATPLHKRGNLRISGNGFRYSGLFKVSGFNIEGGFKLASVRVAYDLLPFAGSFHISPMVMAYDGIRFNGNVTVQPSYSIYLNNTAYYSSTSDPIKGTPTVILPKTAPGLTIGWGNILPRGDRRHLSFPFEIGGVYTGQPKVNLNLTGSACDSTGTNCGSIANNSEIQANIAAQENYYLNKYSWLRFYPIVQFGVGVKF
ncbi:MAG: hypothetical protein WDN23_22505 [Edaphobacter sp.]